MFVDIAGRPRPNKRLVQKVSWICGRSLALASPRVTAKRKRRIAKRRGSHVAKKGSNNVDAILRKRVSFTVPFLMKI